MSQRSPVGSQHGRSGCCLGRQVEYGVGVPGLDGMPGQLRGIDRPRRGTQQGERSPV